MSAGVESSRRSASGLRLTTIGGVPVYIGRSWSFIAVIIVVTYGPQIANDRPDLGNGAYAVALAYAGLLLVSVLAPDAAPAVVATRSGLRVPRALPRPWGGHARSASPPVPVGSLTRLPSTRSFPPTVRQIPTRASSSTRRTASTARPATSRTRRKTSPGSPLRAAVARTIRRCEAACVS